MRRLHTAILGAIASACIAPAAFADPVAIELPVELRAPTTPTADSNRLVIVEASGTTEAEASLNAMRTALEQIAGAYVHSETHTKMAQVVSDDINVVSKGAVKSLSILHKRTDETGLITLRAAVTVSTESVVMFLKSHNMVIVNGAALSGGIAVRDANIAAAAQALQVATNNIGQSLNFQLPKPEIVSSHFNEKPYFVQFPVLQYARNMYGPDDIQQIIRQQKRADGDVIRGELAASWLAELRTILTSGLWENVITDDLAEVAFGQTHIKIPQKLYDRFAASVQGITLQFVIHNQDGTKTYQDLFAGGYAANSRASEESFRFSRLNQNHRRTRHIPPDMFDRTAFVLHAFVSRHDLDEYNQYVFHAPLREDQFTDNMRVFDFFPIGRKVGRGSWQQVTNGPDEGMYFASPDKGNASFIFSGNSPYIGFFITTEALKAIKSISLEAVTPSTSIPSVAKPTQRR